MLLVGYNMGRRRGSEPWLLPVWCLLPVVFRLSLLYAAWVLLAGLSAAGCPQKLVQRTWRAGKAARTVV